MTGSMPSVRYSIIVPTRDRPDALSACLGGLSGMNFNKSEFEVIIVNDGGLFNPESVVRPFRENLHITLLSQTSRGGPAMARNAGAAAAKGAFLIFTDDDCVPDQEWIAVLAGRLAVNPDAAYGGKVKTAPGASPAAVATQMMIAYIASEAQQDTRQPVLLTSNNLALSRKRFMTMGGFDASFPLAAGEDRDFCRRWIQKNQPLVYVPDAIVEHHHRQSLGAFLRQHFRYGRGAFRFHARYTDGIKRRILPEPFRYYARLVLYPARKEPFGKALRLSGLLLISQMASFLGYFYESLRIDKNICI